MALKFKDRLKFLFKNEFDEASLSASESWLIDALGGRKSKAGIAVNHENALKVTAAYACVNVISSTIACIPFNVYQMAENGGRVKLRKHPIYRLLNTEWNEFLTAFRGWRITMVNALLTEAGYIEIIRKKGIPAALYPIPSKFVEKKINKRTLQPQYIVTVDGEKYEVNYRNMIEIPGLAADGYSAYDPVSLLREALGLSLAAEQFSEEYFATGTHPVGVITYPEGLREDRRKNFEKDMRTKYSGLGKKERLMLLENNMKFEKVSIAPEEGQMIESRKFQVNEVARFFNVPPHKIMDLDRATWSNIEEMNISFVNDTIAPWIRNIEQAVMQSMIFKGEKEDGIYAEFDLNGLMRGRMADRYSAYAQGIQNGFLSPNEVRAMENRPAYDGGDSFRAPLNTGEVGKE